MYKEIQRLAEEALALQNKDRMDAALRQISALCDQAAEQQPDASSLSKASLEDLCRDVLASGEDITLRPTEATFKVDAGAAPVKAKGRKGGAQ
jgi:hypothetical protein